MLFAITINQYWVKLSSYLLYDFIVLGNKQRKRPPGCLHF